MTKTSDIIFYRHFYRRSQYLSPIYRRFLNLSPIYRQFLNLSPFRISILPKYNSIDLTQSDKMSYSCFLPQSFILDLIGFRESQEACGLEGVY